MPLNDDSLPPHDLESERAVLGAIILAPSCMAECANFPPECFYDLRHRDIFRAAKALHERHAPIDVITLSNALDRGGRLTAVGGAAFISTLPDATPACSALPYYLDTLREKWALRKAQQVAVDILQRIKANGTADFGDTMFATLSDLQSLSTLRHLRHESETVSDLLSFDAANDPNCLLGARYLCRGQGAWLIGPSGVGKSALILQMAFVFALGQALFGIAPARPLRTLIIQAENDKGDRAEAAQGVLGALRISEFEDVESLVAINERVRIVTEREAVGVGFCAWLSRVIDEHQADVVFIDPLLSFAGIDVTRQDQCTTFLRQGLNPVLNQTGAALIGSHHTGKPKEAKVVQEWTALDYAYSGIGSSELVNWARAVQVLVPNGDIFELKLAKRGHRALATHPNGEHTTTLFLRHAKGRIHWEQINPPDPATLSAGRAKRVHVMEDILPHVPVGKPIPKTVLKDKATSAGIPVNRIYPLITELTTAGILHEWREKRSGTNPLTLISRTRPILPTNAS